MNNQQVAHEWANQTKEKAEGNNFYFDGAKIYSYGSHYLLGNLYPDKNLALINSNGYSVTTAKHKHQALKALSSQWVIIQVPNPGAESKEEHKANAQYLHAQAVETLAKIKTARVRLGDLLVNLETQQYNLIQYAKHFKATAGKLPGLTSKEVEAYKADWELYKQKAAIAQAKKEERARLAEIKDLEDWRKGLNNKYFYHITALRLSKDKKEIETSKGARVGILSAKALYKRFKAGQDLTGQEINGFPVTGADAEFLTIGCHKIAIKEIESLMEGIK